MRAAPDRLTEMLTRLKLTAVRDQLDGLLDQAGRQELSLRETLVMLCERQQGGMRTLPSGARLPTSDQARNRRSRSPERAIRMRRNR